MNKITLIQKIKHLKNDFKLSNINDPELNNKLQQLMQVAPQIMNTKEDNLLIQILVQTIQSQHTLSTTKLSDFIYNTVFKITKFKIRIPFTINLSNDGQTFTQNYMDTNVRLHLVQSIAEEDIFKIVNSRESLKLMRNNISTDKIKAYLKQKMSNKQNEINCIKKFQFNTLDDQLFDGNSTNQITVENNQLTFTAHLILALSQFEIQNNAKEQYYNDIINNLKGYPLNIGWTTPQHQKVQLYL